MTPDERALLLHVARWIVEQEDKDAEKLGASYWASDMRSPIENIWPANPGA